MARRRSWVVGVDLISVVPLRGGISRAGIGNPSLLVLVLLLLLVMVLTVMSVGMHLDLVYWEDYEFL